MHPFGTWRPVVGWWSKESASTSIPELMPHGPLDVHLRSRALALHATSDENPTTDDQASTDDLGGQAAVPWAAT